MTFLKAFLSLLVFGIIINMVDIWKEYRKIKLAYNTCFWMSLVCYLYTAICNPGIIIPTHNNSIENSNQLEREGYSYCTICQLYKPKDSYHCSICGVCIAKYF